MACLCEAGILVSWVLMEAPLSISLLPSPSLPFFSTSCFQVQAKVSPLRKPPPPPPIRLAAGARSGWHTS